LKEIFGFSSFRKGQEDIVKHILEGRDVLGIMPTGAGKSLCYQIPALALGGVSVVVSPLISLMKDQVDALRQNGVKAAALHSSMDWDEARQIMSAARRGQISLLYVAPERFESEGFRNLFAALGVKLFVIDEAHCVSQWGHDFRPSYLSLAAAAALPPQRPVVAAFTATATPEVRDDVASQLNLKNPFVLTMSFERENLFFRVERPKEKTAFLLSYIQRFSAAPGIVFCSTRRWVEDVHDFLRGKGIDAVRYHAGLDDEERLRNQESFIYDRCPIMVATNAFGMGIDKSNVRYVLHFNMPGSIESYYQEAGRAGRDGDPAECALLFALQDVVTARFLIGQNDNADNKQAAYRKLQAMVDYCNTDRCLRATILRYFGETGTKENCAACGNCTSADERVDVTVEAKKILSCVYRMEELTGRRFGIGVLIDVLRGSQKEQIKALGLDEISTWGLMKEYGREEVKEMADFLTSEGYLEVEGGEYPVLGFTPRTRPFLRGKEKLWMRKRAPRQQEPAGPKAVLLPANAELFERLRALRRELAGAQNVPPYVVFTDAALHGMCSALPENGAGFLAIPGVGQVKLEKYGERFLQVLRDWRLEQEKAGHRIVLPEIALPEIALLQKGGDGRSPLSDTERISYELAAEGKTVPEIAEARKLTVGTIETHLLAAVCNGYPVADSLFVTPEDERLILQVVRELKTDRLTSIKEKLPPRIGYNALRFVRHKHKL
jgi:ATP-dependent DNA helicase RecQ